PACSAAIQVRRARLALVNNKQRPSRWSISYIHRAILSASVGWIVVGMGTPPPNTFDQKRIYSVARSYLSQRLVSRQPMREYHRCVASRRYERCKIKLIPPPGRIGTPTA